MNSSPQEQFKESKPSPNVIAEPIIDLVMDLKVTVKSGHCILHPANPELDETNNMKGG